MELFASQNPRSYSLYFDLKTWFRARNVTGAFEKRAPGWLWLDREQSVWCHMVYTWKQGK